MERTGKFREFLLRYPDHHEFLLQERLNFSQRSFLFAVRDFRFSLPGDTKLLIPRLPPLYSNYLFFTFMDLSGMMKQAQKMQADVQRTQESLAQKFVEASVAGGKVKVTASATGDVTNISIDPVIVDPSDVAMLEDLILSAVRQAITDGRKVAEGEMKKITGGMGLPPGLGF